MHRPDYAISTVAGRGTQAHSLLQIPAQSPYAPTTTLYTHSHPVTASLSSFISSLALPPPSLPLPVELPLLPVTIPPPQKEILARICIPRPNPRVYPPRTTLSLAKSPPLGSDCRVPFYQPLLLSPCWLDTSLLAPTQLGFIIH